MCERCIWSKWRMSSYIECNKAVNCSSYCIQINPCCSERGLMNLSTSTSYRFKKASMFLYFMWWAVTRKALYWARKSPAGWDFLEKNIGYMGDEPSVCPVDIHTKNSIKGVLDFIAKEKWKADVLQQDILKYLLIRVWNSRKISEKIQSAACTLALSKLIANSCWFQ